MPNWCANTLTLEHEDPAMIERAKTAFAEGKLLAEFCPVPKALQIVAGRVGSDEDPKQIELKAQTMHNLSTYGYATWYDYCVNEWGTKWDVGSDDGINEFTDTTLVLYFDSAWAPPLAAYKAMEELGFTVRAMYYEPGLCFAGIYEDGFDDYYEYANLSSEEVADMIPDELDETFNISEQLADWEEENENEP